MVSLQNLLSFIYMLKRSLVSRHLGSMTLTAAPTFHRPDYYNNHQSSYLQGNPPPYSEYDNQVRYLATQSPLNDSGYWENTRDNAVRMLNEQAGPYVLNRRIYATYLYNLISRSYQYPEHTDWAPSEPSSSFQTRPFAHSVFQRTTPSSAYPTPPPPGISASSSSLAFALGGPPSQPKLPPPLPKVYQPQDSHAFYEDFLEQKTRQINPLPLVRSDTLRAITPPPKAQAMSPEESPDPLAIQSHTDFTVSPKKRKPVVDMESPSIKRMHSVKSFVSHSGSQPMLPKTPQSKAPLTPGSSMSSTSQMSVNTTPTVKRVVNLAYVSIPSSPWSTPKGSMVIDPRSKHKVRESPGDLGGYGSEDDGPPSPTKGRSVHDSAKSSARRTGDRDERGRYLLSLM
jgi:cohesin loading factor subunit SCC2